jgi:hypothetical protein
MQQQLWRLAQVAWELLLLLLLAAVGWLLLLLAAVGWPLLLQMPCWPSYAQQQS